jgi:ABC-type phosphate transport system substrate-binding protein
MHMKNRRQVAGGMLVSAMAVAMLLGAGTANAQISVVVAAGSSLTATPTQAADMFSGVKTVWPSGTKVQIVDQAETDTGRAFYQKCVKRPPTIVRAQWTRLTLSGQAVAPKTVSGDAEVKEAVKKLPGAIGYIASASLDASVKEVCRIE